MPGEMSHHSRLKLKPQEAALLAGELKKPTWESRNEGIHERVSFEDAIWGFDLAGGAYYKTPLRVTAVKPESRAAKAGIRAGDRLLRINDIDTSTLTIQEAHKIIIESGVHLRLAVTAPEDLEDSYHCWEDQLEDGYDSEEERRIEEEKERKRRVHAKVSSYWSLQWPWVSKRRVIYRESNCFMVPSKYESNHKDLFSEQPSLKTPDDVVLFSSQKEDKLKYRTGKTPPQSPISNSVEHKKPDFQVKQTNKMKLPFNGSTSNGKIEKIDEESDESSVSYQKDDDIIQEILDNNIIKTEQPTSVSQNENSQISNKSVDDTVKHIDEIKEELIPNGLNQENIKNHNSPSNNIGQIDNIDVGSDGLSVSYIKEYEDTQEILENNNIESEQKTISQSEKAEISNKSEDVDTLQHIDEVKEEVMSNGFGDVQVMNKSAEGSENVNSDKQNDFIIAEILTNGDQNMSQDDEDNILKDIDNKSDINSWVSDVGATETINEEKT